MTVCEKKIARAISLINSAEFLFSLILGFKCIEELCDVCGAFSDSLMRCRNCDVLCCETCIQLSNLCPSCDQMVQDEVDEELEVLLLFDEEEGFI